MKFNVDMLKRWGFAQGASEKHLNEQEALLCAPGAQARAVGPSGAAGANCSQMAGGRAVRSPGPRQPQDPPPSKPKFGDTVGIFFKKYLLTVLFDFL